MCLADVTGHGEAVGAVSAEIHTLLRKHMNAMDERVVLRSLNRRLADGQFDRLTTAAAVSYFPPMRELSVSYAGHPPAWVYRVEQKRWKRLPPGSEGDGRVGLVDLPLGVDQATRFSRRRERVATGDGLLVLTDGILEAPSPGGDLFGVEQLEALLAEGADLTVQELADAILGSLRSHAGSDRLDHDDVTMLLVEFVPGPRGLGTVWHMMKNRLLPKRWH